MVHRHGKRTGLSAGVIGPCVSACAPATTTNYCTSVCRNVTGRAPPWRPADADRATVLVGPRTAFECAGSVRAIRAAPHAYWFLRRLRKSVAGGVL